MYTYVVCCGAFSSCVSVFRQRNHGLPVIVRQCKSWRNRTCAVKINWHSVRPHKAWHAMHYPLFCLQFTARFSSHSGHRLRKVYFWRIKRVLFSRQIFPVTKPYESVGDSDRAQWWGSFPQHGLAFLCGDLLSGARGSTETTKWSFICSIDFPEGRKKG